MANWRGKGSKIVHLKKDGLDQAQCGVTIWGDGQYVEEPSNCAKCLKNHPSLFKQGVQRGFHKPWSIRGER